MGKRKGKKKAGNRSAPPPYEEGDLGRVLVTGGCGFIGSHIVHQLIEDTQYRGRIYVIDKDINRDLFHDDANVRYLPCDITATHEVEVLMSRIRPQVIFHTASPNAYYDRRDGFWCGRYYQTNVTATANLLRMAKMPAYGVQVFVYTSAPCVYKTDHKAPIRESERTHNGRPWPWEAVCESVWTKGVAHNMVLDENESWRQGGLKTVVIVPGIVYGVGDSKAIRLIFDAFQNPAMRFFRIGNGRNRASFVEAVNCANFHIMAAKALVVGGKDLAGKALNATDGGDDVPTWWHIGITCAAIRGYSPEAANEATFVTIPAWVALVAVHITWWLFLIFTFGYSEPPFVLSVEGYKWATKDRMLNVRHSEKLLDFVPNPRARWHEEIVEASVEYERERRGLPVQVQQGQEQGGQGQQGQEGQGQEQYPHME